MKLKSLWLIPSLLLCASVFADDHGSPDSGVSQETKAGSLYSSQQTLDRGFPFSDAVSTAGGLVFLSGLVGMNLKGELVEGGLVPETHAIFRQMQNHLGQMG